MEASRASVTVRRRRAVWDDLWSEVRWPLASAGWATMAESGRRMES